jgi:trehalose synthase-fused probable maltokinase
VFDLAATRQPTLPAAVSAPLHELLARRDAVFAVLGGLADIESPAALIRIHGDFHLGQMLLRLPELEPLVIDFEGEPGRSLADRRRKTTALKDVAGMCRSFDYSLRHAARSGGPPYDAAHLHLLETRYLGAYRAVAHGQIWWPGEATAADAILATYKLDKALYELAYELGNRPDWVEVPLEALVALSAAAAITTPAARARPW